MASGISFSGLSSGIDTNTIVSRLMALERQPIAKAQTEKGKIGEKQAVHQEINTLLKALRDKARALLDVTNLQTKAATLSDTSIGVATATPNAAAGSYNLNVTSLAKAHTMASAASPVISADTLHIGVGTTTVNVAITGTETLQQVADKINGTANTPVSASVVNDKLVMISKTTGTAGSISLTSDAGLAAALGMTSPQPGADAAVTINGLLVTSSGNTINDAINGVSLTLSKEGSAVLNVALDGKAVEAKVKEFVDAYNNLIDNLGRTTKYDVATKAKGTLQGDQGLTTFLGQLRNSATSPVSTLAGGALDQLAQIGITTSTDRSGKLVIDSGKLQRALADNIGAVADVFGKDDGVTGGSMNDGVARRLADLADDFSSNVMGQRLQGFTDRLGRLDKRIADLEVVMTAKEKRMKQQFTAMEQAISRFQAQGSEVLSRLGLSS